MGKMQRDKGKRGEREAAKLLSDFGYPARRAQQYSGVAGIADLVCPSFDDEAVCIEVKNTARPNIGAWIDKAWQDCLAEMKSFVIMWKRPRDDWYVIMPAATFLSVARRGIKPKKLPDGLGDEDETD